MILFSLKFPVTNFRLIVSANSATGRLWLAIGDKSKKYSLFHNNNLTYIYIMYSKSFYNNREGKCCLNECTNNDAFKCSGCKFLAHYCSKECQKLDWKRHKAECNYLESGN